MSHNDFLKNEGWSDDTIYHYTHSTFDDKPFSYLERYIKEKGESFDEWLNMWRAYTGIALPAINERMYDLAVSVKDFEIVRWAATNQDIYDLCEKSIKNIEQKQYPLPRNAKNTEHTKNKQLYLAFDQLEFFLTNIISVDDLYGEDFSQSGTLSSLIRHPVILLESSGILFSNVKECKESLDRFNFVIKWLNILADEVMFNETSKETAIEHCKNMLGIVREGMRLLITPINKEASGKNRTSTNIILNLEKNLKLLESERERIQKTIKDIIYPKMQTLKIKNIKQKKENIIARKSKCLNRMKTLSDDGGNSKKNNTEIEKILKKMAIDKRKLHEISTELSFLENDLASFKPDIKKLNPLQLSLNEINLKIEVIIEKIKFEKSKKEKFMPKS